MDGENWVGNGLVRGTGVGIRCGESRGCWGGRRGLEERTEMIGGISGMTRRPGTGEAPRNL